MTSGSILMPHNRYIRSSDWWGEERRTSRLPGSTSTQACTSLLRRGGSAASEAGVALEPAPPGASGLELALAGWAACAKSALALALPAAPGAAVPARARGNVSVSTATSGLRWRLPSRVPELKAVRGERRGAVRRVRASRALLGLVLRVQAGLPTRCRPAEGPCANAHHSAGAIPVLCRRPCV